MAKLKSYLAKNPGVVIAFALAGFLSSFSAGLDLAHGDDAMAVMNTVGLIVCALMLISGVREIAAKKRMSRDAAEN